MCDVPLRKRFFSEHLNNWRMLAHLATRGTFRDLHRDGTEIDGRDGVKPCIPVNVRRSIFYDISPIRNDGLPT